MDWKHLLAYITGTVDQELLLRHEYLVTENRILRNQLTGRVRLSDGERKTLAEIGQKLGKQALKDRGHDRQARHDSWLAPDARGPEV
jgi:putative transposase